MALKGGAMLHTVHDTVLVERLQNAGPGTVNIPVEKIYELGNYESVATIRDVPDLTFTLESLDVSTDLEAFLLDVSPDEDEFDLAAAKPVNIATQIKPGKKQPDPFTVAKAVAVPYLTIESVSYRFGLRDNATQTVTFRGDSIFYCPGPVYVDTFIADGTEDQVLAISHPAFNYTDANGTRRVLAVVAGTERLTYGPDYSLADAGSPNGDGADLVSVTLRKALPNGQTVRVVYSSSDPREYPQAVHTPATLKPAAVRGKDIDVHIGGYFPDGRNKWTGVQSVQIDWSVTQEVEEEFGNYYAVSRDFDIPSVSGSIDILPRNAEDLWAKIRQITGVTESNRVIGAATAVPLPVDVVIKDGENEGATLKRFHIKDARFSVPGYSPRPEQNVTMTMSFESDSGALTVHRDLGAPIVAFTEPAEVYAGEEVKVRGVGFVGVESVEVDGTPVAFTVQSNRQLTITAPAAPVAGDTLPIVVTNKAGEQVKAAVLQYGEVPSALTIDGPAGVAEGGTVGLSATATFGTVPSTFTRTVTDRVVWTSSAPAVATVDGGVVTGVTAGTSDITATLAGVSSAVHEVTVS